MLIIADENIPLESQLFSSIGLVKTIHGRKITHHMLSDADILLVRSITPVNFDLLNKSRIKIVGVACTGTDHVDIGYLDQQNIKWCSAAGANANSVADYVAAALFELQHRQIIDIPHISLGIIGVGNIGQIVQKKWLELGINLKVYDPIKSLENPNFHSDTFDDVCGCDVITYHVPLTYDEEYPTYKMINSAFLNRCKNGVILINTSRGEIMDELALKAALNSGFVKAAVLDVWQNEPNIDLELLNLTTIGTPHIAGYSYEGKIKGVFQIYDQICQFLNIKPAFVLSDFLKRDQPALTPAPSPTFAGEGSPWINWKQVYDIAKDDAMFRQNPSAFDLLRKNYPVRHEFWT